MILLFRIGILLGPLYIIRYITKIKKTNKEGSVNYNIFLY